MEHRAALIEAIEKTTAGEPRAHWLARLERRGCPRVPSTPMRKRWPIRTRWRDRWWSTSCIPGAGPIKALGIPVKLSDTPGAVDRPAPLLGQHTADILTELGYTDAEQRALPDRGVI